MRKLCAAILSAAICLSVSGAPAEFSVSAWWVNGWYPTASISDLLVVVMKKATAGITIS
ncbi:Ail/Lom family outer membrane beta-barrel protein [Escherichia coli]|nr:Ail/Lom family outer membrane beta-barrel protein [Escherichia coli]